jgi:hypothetical protein
MKFPPREYAGHLPYGLWFDPETREEHLFNRSYQCIASRSVDRPCVVALRGKPQRLECPVELWFHNDASDSHAALSWDAMRRCEKILARFTLGYDVREFVVIGRDEFRGVEGAAYRSDEPVPVPVEGW